MNLGEFKREVVVEPRELPEPLQKPAPAPQRRSEPVEEPAAR